MRFEARTIRMLCARNYDYLFKFPQVVEDYTGDSFLRHSVEGQSVKCISLTNGRAAPKW